MIKKNIDVPISINVNIDGIVISKELLSEAIDYLELINRQYLKNGDILHHDDLIDKLKKARGDDDVWFDLDKFCHIVYMEYDFNCLDCFAEWVSEESGGIVV